MTGNPLLDGLLPELEKGWASLPDKPEETPDNTLLALWAAANEDEDRVRGLLSRRMAGVPLAHLTGQQRFMNLAMLAGPEALIPRKETEILCTGAFDLLKRMMSERRPARVLDLCCGSGNVGLALAALEPGCEVWLGDISDEAIGLARKNAVHLNVVRRTHIVSSDLFSAFPLPEFGASFDLITCNPPYISSAKVERMHPEIADFEPRLAFDGGPFGVKVITRLIREAPLYLKSSGWLAFEVGAGQGPPVAKIVRNDVRYSHVETLADGNGETRTILGKVA